ncbi:MAG: hypothetical protein HC876_19140 [Chloroflexaceae bacterium]|nr:hypothetical protein [Chloroflexaceae bacterium]
MWSILSPTGATLPLADVSVRVRTAGGSGMPPIVASTAPPLVTSTGQRRLTLHLVAQQREAHLAALRSTLIAALNPALTTASSLAYLRYTHAGTTVQLPIQYVGGLEDPPDSNELTLQCIAHDPLWTTTSTTSQPLTVRQTIGSVAHIIQRSAAGVWSAMPGLNSAVAALLVAPDGTLYAGRRV